jgi:hypothetical protein
MPDAPHGGIQAFGSSAERHDRFLNVALGGGDPDLEAGGEAVFRQRTNELPEQID